MVTTVTINVGGESFKISKELLQKTPNKILDNADYLEMDPELFKYVLNYLRYGTFLFPNEFYDPSKTISTDFQTCKHQEKMAKSILGELTKLGFGNNVLKQFCQEHGIFPWYSPSKIFIETKFNESKSSEWKEILGSFNVAKRFDGQNYLFADIETKTSPPCVAVCQQTESHAFGNWQFEMIRSGGLNEFWPISFFEHTEKMVPKTPDPDAPKEETEDKSKNGVSFEEQNERTQEEETAEKAKPKETEGEGREKKEHTTHQRLMRKNVPKGYFLFVNENNKLCFARSDGSEEGIIILAKYDEYQPDYTWVEIRIRRDHTGNFEFFENGKLIMTCYDIKYKKSDNVHISINNYTNGFANIIVSSEI